jgi:hypothetical protein
MINRTIKQQLMEEKKFKCYKIMALAIFLYDITTLVKRKEVIVELKLRKQSSYEMGRFVLKETKLKIKYREGNGTECVFSKWKN